MIMLSRMTCANLKNVRLITSPSELQSGGKIISLIRGGVNLSSLSLRKSHKVEDPHSLLIFELS